MNRGSRHGIGLFLLCFLVLLSACESDAGRAGKSSASPTLVVSAPIHAAIDAVAATNEVVYLAGSDGSLTARQAENGRVIWYQRNVAVLSGQYSNLVSTAQVLYDAYNTTATTARVEARQISNGQVVWSRDIPHRLGPGFVAIMVDAGMVYVNTIFPPNHGLLYALRASDGQVLWQYSLQGLPMDSSVYVTNGIVAVVDTMTAGSIHILHGDDGSPLLSYSCPPVQTGIQRPMLLRSMSTARIIRCKRIISPMEHYYGLPTIAANPSITGAKTRVLSIAILALSSRHFARWMVLSSGKSRCQHTPLDYHCKTSLSPS